LKVLSTVKKKAAATKERSLDIITDVTSCLNEEVIAAIPNCK
jgi:hypothetical protein